MYKSIQVVLDDTGLQVESNYDSGLIKIRLNNFTEDTNESKPGHDVFKEKDVVEVFPSFDDVKEIIKALQQVLPEEEKDKK